jgi:hypothetical protein
VRPEERENLKSFSLPLRIRNKTNNRICFGQFGSEDVVVVDSLSVQGKIK